VAPDVAGCGRLKKAGADQSPTSIQSVVGNQSSRYDLHPDGNRVATAAAEQRGGGRDTVVFVFNFGDYPRTIAPGKE
jgi:hypothetical protein